MGIGGLKANDQLIAAHNPCPCGHKTVKNGKCFCSPVEGMRYTGRVSVPVANSFGLHIELGFREKIPNFDEFREIFPDFD